MRTLFPLACMLAVGLPLAGARPQIIDEDGVAPNAARTPRPDIAIITDDNAKAQSPPASDDTDQCGITANNWLQQIGQLPPKQPQEGLRLLYPGSPATQDYVPGRLNIRVGPTGRIVAVYCG